MHEVGVASGILDAVRQETAARGLGRPTKVGVRIGEMAGIDPESLAFCFEALVKGTDLEPLELVIERGRADELVFAFLEVDDDDTPADGRQSP
jgi:hydrogenase nickel incorporation protein HypA/HybF